CSPRSLRALTLLTGMALLLYSGTQLTPGLTHAQVKETGQLPPAVDPPPAAPKGDAFTLPTDRPARQKLEAAEDYIKEEAWKEAAGLLQAVLDMKEDSFFLV